MTQEPIRLATRFGGRDTRVWVKLLILLSFCCVVKCIVTRLVVAGGRGQPKVLLLSVWKGGKATVLVDCGSLARVRFKAGDKR